MGIGGLAAEAIAPVPGEVLGSVIDVDDATPAQAEGGEVTIVDSTDGEEGFWSDLQLEDDSDEMGPDTDGEVQASEPSGVPRSQTPPAPSLARPQQPAESASAAVAIAGECVICMDAGASHLVAPCGHQCLCATCATQVDNCPVCRGPAALCIRVFASGVHASKVHRPPEATPGSEKKTKNKKEKKKEKKGKKESRQSAQHSGSRKRRRADAASTADGDRSRAVIAVGPEVEGAVQRPASADADLGAPTRPDPEVLAGPACVQGELESSRVVLECPLSSEAELTSTLEHLAGLGNVSEDLIRSTRIGKVVGTMSKKDARPRVRQAAETLTMQWLRAVRLSRSAAAASASAAPSASARRTRESG